VQEIPQDSVLTVEEFCKLVSEAKEGSSLSFVGTATTAVNGFAPVPSSPYMESRDTPMWPSLVSTACSNSVSVYELQPGGKDSCVWTVQGRDKTLVGMNVMMQDTHCIVFDETCDGVTIQGAKFEGMLNFLHIQFSSAIFIADAE
jgi:hypothetical protein